MRSIGNSARFQNSSDPGHVDCAVETWMVIFLELRAWAMGWSAAALTAPDRAEPAESAAGSSDHATPHRGPAPGCGAGPAQALRRSWLLIGNWRIRLPVAAAMALSTEGAATKMVGSPTPPQKPPEGITMASTLGIWLIRITW